jgi:hypothetical protein
MIDKIIINKISVNHLKPTKKKFRNKNNKFSAQGYYGNEKVKVYEVFDKNQGDLRKFISKSNELSQYFPKLITYDSKYIVEEWVIGQTLKEVNSKYNKHVSQADEIKKIINLMWSLNYDKIVFNYIEYIHSRLNKINNFDLRNVPVRVNHNDLSLDNILMTSDGLKIIDNELLGCNNGWILNIKNSFLKEDFTYQNYISTDTLDALWNIRKEWSKSDYSGKSRKNWLSYNFIKKILIKLKRFIWHNN